MVPYTRPDDSVDCRRDEVKDNTPRYIKTLEEAWDSHWKGDGPAKIKENERIP